ncbi:hypothetical protein JTB14_007484 [Gonioctena quinquepunctata]|nr:hypothetical protein JTB14_007484 [Gonioctena quinquepunctata]
MGKNSSTNKITFALFYESMKRDIIFSSIRNLKGMGSALNDMLLKSQRDHLNKSREILGMKNCWAWKGRIFTSVEGNAMEIMSATDLENYVK